MDKVYILSLEHHNTSACETTTSIIGAYSSPLKAQLAICNTYPNLNWKEIARGYEAELVICEDSYISFEIIETVIE